MPNRLAENMVWQRLGSEHRFHGNHRVCFIIWSLFVFIHTTNYDYSAAAAVHFSSSSSSCATSPLTGSATTNAHANNNFLDQADGRGVSSGGDGCLLPRDGTTTPQQLQRNRSSSVQSQEMLEWILAEDYKSLDNDHDDNDDDDSDGNKGDSRTYLDRSIIALKQRGAHRCWHKHSTFLQHLLGVHNILRLWGQSAVIGRVGLFHSAYGNSYVNLALFDPQRDRDNVKALIGSEAEEMVYLFCIIDRQEVVVNTLLKRGSIPPDGLAVPHLRYANESVFLSSETLRLLVVFTMADIADQYFGWQDQLFGGGGSDGSMIVPGADRRDQHNPMSLWPGISRPGLWMSYVSQLATVAKTFQSTRSEMVDQAISHKKSNVPPIFDGCTLILSIEDETLARDLYWSVATELISDAESAIHLLKECIDTNPFIFEPHVLLAQLYMHQNDYDRVQHHTLCALRLQEQWGTSWDKRLSFGAWVAWTRVLDQRSRKQEPWPTNSWDVNNLGLVR